MADAPTPPRAHLTLVPVRRPQDVAGDATAVVHDDVDPPYGLDIDIDSEVAEPPGPPALSPRFVVLGLLALQVLGTLSYLDQYVSLTRSTAISPAAAMLSVPAALALYAGALMLVLRPGRGRGLFVAASIGFAIAVPFWGISYGWSWPIAAGSMLGLAGAWVARAAARQGDPQP